LVGRFRDALLARLAIKSVRQCGALPYRVADDGSVAVMLVTSRHGTRWLPPKGWPLWMKTRAATAEIEAYEEAGVRGRAQRPAFGVFEHRKRLRQGRHVVCKIDMYLLRVDQELDRWPEMVVRNRRWFSLEEAAEVVDNQQLRDLLQLLVRERYRLA
jgi:ADP-ribose pyrophosphatase YjhB (NUDIX family)